VNIGHEHDRKARLNSQVGTDDSTSSWVNDRDEEADNDGTVGEKGEGNQWVTSHEAFPQSERNDAYATNRQKCTVENDIVSL